MGMKKFKRLVDNAVIIRGITLTAISDADGYNGHDVYKMTVTHANDVAGKFVKASKKAVKEFFNLREEQRLRRKMKVWLKKNVPDYDGGIVTTLDRMKEEISQKLKLL